MFNRLRALFSGKQKVTYRDGNPPVYHWDGDDSELNAAIEKARSRVGWVIMRLQEHIGPNTYLSIKFQLFDEKGNSEHVWIRDVVWREGKFFGSLDNEPFELNGWKLGDEVSVEPEEITDWILIEDGRVEGNFTYDILVRRAAGR